jgi:hypothetical protein
MAAKSATIVSPGVFRIHPAMFGQIVVMRMFREKGILTQICGNNFMVLKAAPPLMVTAGSNWMNS